jgi:hypothetical protein
LSRFVSLVVVLGACNSDHQVLQLCARDEDGFDIEEASTLEDAQAYPFMHDAVILEFDTSAMPADATWRVRSVDILPMIALVEFDDFDDGQAVSVEIWDADDPQSTDPYVVTQAFDRDALSWEDVTLSNPTTATYPSQRKAWWSFDFGDEIPTSGLTGPEYLVSVSWTGEALPALGYSNFNNACSRNWTDYGDGAGWVLNDGALECSWPMLRVNLEVLEQQQFCSEESEVVE